ncbi:MAG TPA: hypothetical protein VL198_04910 [Pseudolabrys sp.]|jgi:hypothetical protein|nr:hypothetical protein [Pseudolabrys sp.]
MQPARRNVVLEPSGGFRRQKNVPLTRAVLIDEEILMSTAGNLQRGFAPTQLLGAAIQASLWTLSVAQGPFYLARLAGFGGMSGSLATIVAVTILSWLYLFQLFLPSATPLSIQRLPRWLKFFRIMADPSISPGDKIKATVTNWFGLLLILQNAVIIFGAAFAGKPMFS